MPVAPRKSRRSSAVDLLVKSLGKKKIPKFIKHAYVEPVIRTLNNNLEVCFRSCTHLLSIKCFLVY